MTRLPRKLVLRSIRIYPRTTFNLALRAALPFLFTALPLKGAGGETPTAPPFPHEILDRVLKEHVGDTGKVDYRALRLQQHDLVAYVDSLALVSPKSHGSRFSGSEDRLAYWINAYNALVLKGVVAAYPVASVMAIFTEGWFFREQKFAVGGVEMTLDHLENRIIRPEFKDARIHFAINCAAASCPPLENRAFDGPTLEQRLDAATKRFSRTSSHVRIDRDSKTVYLSKIMEWFASDFGADSSARNQNGNSNPESAVAFSSSLSVTERRGIPVDESLRRRRFCRIRLGTERPGVSRALIEPESGLLLVRQCSVAE